MEVPRARSFSFSQCPACGYDLRGAENDLRRCPECGQDQRSPAISAARERRLFAAIWRAIAIYFAIALVLVVTGVLLLREGAINWTPLMVIGAPALILILAILCAKRLPE